MTNKHYVEKEESRSKICEDLDITENQMYKRNKELNIHRPNKLFQKLEQKDKKNYKYNLFIKKVGKTKLALYNIRGNVNDKNL